MEPYYAAGNGKEKGDKIDRHKEDKWEDGLIMATGAISIREFSKRIVDTIDLNEGSERAYRSEKIRRVD